MEEINNEITILERKGYKNLTKDERKRLSDLYDILDELKEDENKKKNARNEQIRIIKEFSNIWRYEWDENTDQDEIFNTQKNLLKVAYKTRINNYKGQSETLSRPDIFNKVIMDYLDFLRNSDRETQIRENYENLLKFVFSHEGLSISQGRGRRKITHESEGYLNTIENMDPDDLYNILRNANLHKKNIVNIDGLEFNIKYKSHLKNLLKYIKNNGVPVDNYDLLSELYNLILFNNDPKKQILYNELARVIFKDDSLQTDDILEKLLNEIGRITEAQIHTDGTQTLIVNEEDPFKYRAQIETAEISDRELSNDDIRSFNNHLSAEHTIDRRRPHESKEDFMNRMLEQVQDEIKTHVPELEVKTISLRIPDNDGHYSNENNDCLRVAIKKITGIDYNKDNIRGIKEFMNKHNKYFGIYNTYGQLIKGYLNNNIKNNCDYDLILYDNHADILPRGVVQQKKINKRVYTTFENIDKIYDIVCKNKLIYKENSHKINKIFKNEWDNMKADEKIKITVYVNDCSLFSFLDSSNCDYNPINPLSKDNDRTGWTKFIYNGDEQKKEMINNYPYFKELGEIDEEELNNVELTDENKFKGMLKYLNKLLMSIEKQEKINIDSFPINYRKRCVNIKYENNKTYYSIDMRNAYKNMLNAALNSTMININNIPIKYYSDIEKNKRINNKDAFIFFVDNCEHLPRGYYYGKFYDVVHKFEPNAYYEFYIINGIFSGKKYLGELIEYLDTLDKLEYVKFIGMLLTVPNSYDYESFNSITQIKNIKFKYTRLPTIHLNMMLKFTYNMLSKIMDIYKNMGVLPVGYKVDSILYNFNRCYPDDEHKQQYYNNLLIDSDLWHSMERYESKNEWIQKEDMDDLTLNNTQISCMFGCAGCGKTTKIINNYVFGGLVIVKNYMLLNDYINKNIPCALYSQIINNHCFYAVNCLYIEEAGTYTNEELSGLINIASNYNINIMLVGDYYQLLPINYNQKLLIEYMDHKYIYNNYRNSLKYDASERFIISAILRGYFTTEDRIKRDELLNKYHDFIKIGYNNDDVVLRWYKVSAINEYNKGIKTRYYMLNNFILSADNYVDNLKNKGIILSMFNKDSLYTADEIKGYEKYFINCNIISFYNTQGKTLNYINIIDNKDYSAIIKDPRMFYVLISRIKE